MARDIQTLRGQHITPIPVPRKRALLTMQVDLSASSTPWANASPMRFPSPLSPTDVVCKPVSVNEVNWCAVCGRGVLITESEQLVADDANEGESVPIHPACRPVP